VSNRWVLFVCAVMACVSLQVSRARASQDVLVIEQEYDLIENARDGVTAKNIRQKIYITKEFMCIDEYGGARAGDAPTESIVIDFKNKEIINLDHENKKKVTEGFEARRKRLEDDHNNKQRDLKDQEEGPQKQYIAKLYRAMLDDSRKFALAKDPGSEKTISGVACKPVKVIDADAPDYAPLQASVHPDVELPYDSAEVLYLLKIIGKNMSKFLSEHKSVFKYVPMELHLDLAAGGKLDTQVVNVQKMSLTSLDPKARGTLGSPFDLPPYEEKQHAPPPRKVPTKKEEKPD